MTILKEIVWIVVSAVIFMIVFTLWTNPSIVSSFKSKIIESKAIITEKVGTDTEKVVVEEDKDKQDFSTQTCLNQINERNRMEKEKSFMETNFNIIEIQKFNDTNSSLNYLTKWDLNNVYLIPSELSNGKEYNDIIIVLIKMEIIDGNSKMGLLYPYVCINGEYIEKK